MIRSTSASGWWWVAVVTILVGARADAEGWRAGAATRVITPREPLWMAGYASRDRPAEGTESDLFCKALLLEDARGKRACLVTLDLVAIDRELAGAVCRRLEAAHGLSRGEVSLAVSHTHCGPIVGKSLSVMTEVIPPEERDALAAWADTLETTIVEVVGEAIAAAGPVELRHGSGRATFAVNRRANPEAEVPARRAEGRLAGPVDHDVPVLAVSRTDGAPVAIVFGYACHATVLSFQQWCADYPGFAQEAIQSRHPGVVALFWAGCGADQNPLPRRTVELARGYGARLADAVEEVLAGPMEPVAARLETTFAEIPLRFASIPSDADLARDRNSADRFVAARARLLARRRAETGRPLDPEYPYPVGLWTLGDPSEGIDWLFLGGEVVVDYCLRFKGERRGTRTWVTAYANDVMAYVPSRRVLVEGGYEGGGAMVYYGQPSPWAEDVETRIADEVRRQGDAPEGTPTP